MVVVGRVDVVVVMSGPVEMCWWCWCGSDGHCCGCSRVWLHQDGGYGGVVVMVMVLVLVLVM